MKKYIYLIIILFLSIKAFAQGHLPGTAVPATPNTAPWNGYTAAPDYRQNASVTNAQSTALLPSGSSGTDIFANYLVDTTGYTFYLVYTTNGTVPTKTNGTVVNMSFAVVSGSNRIWGGKIPQQLAGTVVNYVIYANTTGGTLAAANNRIASSRLGIQATWTEGDTYYSMITPGGVTNTVAWYKADTGLAATTWADQSGHNYNLTRTSAPAGSVTLNFNPVASFTGVTANQYNNTATKAAWPVGSNATTYYYVAKNSAAIANRAALGIGANGASTGFHSGQVATTGLISSAGATAFTTGVATASLASPPDWDNTKSNQGINLVRTGYDSGAGRNYVAAQGSAPTNNTNSVNPTYTNTSPFRIGASGDNGIFWNGDVAEVIVFPSQHASTDYLKVESYLALKYGITKTGAYQLSNGTSLYNDATYNNNIAGIGRDDASTLNQKQSQSQNSGLQPVIGNVNIAATNTGNANNFSADLSALVWGSDTGTTSFATSFAFGGLNNRMTRIWRVQETGTVGTVKVALPASQIAGNISSLNLVVSADATFDGTDTRTAMTLETLGGLQYYTATVDFTSGQFFSFAAFATAPGGVISGLAGWYKENASNTGVLWKNALGSNDATGTGTNVYNTSGSDLINFNPSYTFNTTGIFTLPSALDLSGSYSVSGVAKLKTAGSNGRVFGSSLSNVLIGYWGNLMNTVYYDAAPNSLTSGSNSVISSTTDVRNYTYIRNAGPFSFYGNSASILTAGTSGATAFRGTIGGSFGENSNVIVPEYITYNLSLSVTDQNKVESYLAIKYGYTKSGNYVLSSNADSWNATTNTGYNNNIAGIARDDFSGLNQKQSASQNSGIQPVIGNVNITDTNANNTNSFAADLSSLVWGSDAGSASFGTSFIFGGLTRRMTRIWRVQETGTVGTVKVALPASQVAGNISSLNLVVSADATFDGSDTRTAMILETLGGVQYYTATVDFTTGQFFTFAALVTAPGGVSNGLALWLDPDSGIDNSTNISTWTDRVNGVIIPRKNTTTTLSVKTILNFNKVVDLPTGNYNGFELPSSDSNISRYDPNATDGMSVFGVGIHSTGWNDFAPLMSKTNGGAWDSGWIMTTTNPSGSNWSLLYVWGNESGSGVGNSAVTPTGSLIRGNAFVASGWWDPALTNKNNVDLNAVATGSINVSTTSSVGSPLGIGYAQGYALGGQLGDQIYYNRSLSNTERARVQSYLSIKFGTTLGNTALPFTYLNSSVNTIWTGDATYQNNIGAIARDDASALNQKQSQSVNNGTQVVIGNGSIAASNAANTSNFTTDLSSLVWGDNALSLTYTTSVTNNIPSGLVFANRMSRIWKVQETGTVGAVKIAMRAAAVANGENAYIIVSTDPTFGSGNTWYPLTASTTINGITYYTADVDFTSVQYFTFAIKMIGPGGVLGSSLWLRADMAGTYTNNAAVNNWDDVSVNDNDVSQSTVANQPLYKSNTTDNINFNPVIDFDGSNDILSDANGIIGTSTYNNASAFTVNATRVISNSSIFQESLGTGTQINLHTPWSDGNVYWDGANNSRINTAWGGTLNTPYLWTGWNNNSLTPRTSLRRNGLQITSGGTLASYTGNNSAMNVGSTYNGKIGEVVFNPNALSVNERQRVESYLAIKYGFTLDQTTAQNYLNSASAVIWNATTNTGYNNNIAGIMRDDASGLTQKQSQSVNSGLQPVIGNVNIADTNANNTNNFAADLSSLVWGSDTGSTSFATSFVFGGLTTRITRIWRVQETGTVGNVKVALPASQFSGSITQLNLVTSADATFDGTDTRTAMALETLGGVQYYTATVDFTTGQFFTFAAIATAPGGVFTGLTRWHKADSGVATATGVSSWTDQTAGASMTQGTTANQPVYNTASNLMNFNPSISFDGSNDALTNNVSGLPQGAAASTFYFVDRPTAANTGRFALAYGATSGTASFQAGPAATFSTKQAGGSVFASQTGAYTVSIPSLTRAGYDGTRAYLSHNGLTEQTSTTYTQNVSTNSFAIGARADGAANFFTGDIPEVVAYTGKNSASELIRVESYLAVKYGITKTGDYQNSAATVIWTNDASYQNNVFGILRDDVSALHQRISKSVNSGSVLTLSTDTNFTNANSTHAAIGTDLQSLVIGETTGAYTFTGTALTASGITFSTTEAMAKRWKVQDTGGISCINLRFDATSLPALSGNERYYLIVSDDANFTSNVVYRAVTRTGNNIDVSVNFRDNNVSYFTLAKKDLGISGGDLTDVKSGISTIPSAAWKPTLPNTYLEINSNSKGLVVSRVASTAAIVNPIEGMIIYDLSDNTMKVYTGTIWRKLGDYSTGSNGNINIFCN